MALRLEECILEFFNALIEGRARSNDEVILALGEQIDIDQMLANLDQHYKKSKSKDYKDEDFNEIIYQYYAFLTAVADNLE